MAPAQDPAVGKRVGHPALDGVVERGGEEAHLALLLRGTHGAQQGARPADHAGGVLGTVEGHVVVRIAVPLVAGPDEGKGAVDAIARNAIMPARWAATDSSAGFLEPWTMPVVAPETARLSAA